VRVVIVDTYYDAFLNAHYAASRGLAGRPYTEQWRSLMDTRFGTADAYSFFLRELGHEAHELVINCRPLQEAWASESGLGRGRRGIRRGRKRLLQIALAQVAAFEPDVVYVQDLHVFQPDELRTLRAGGALLVGQLGTEPPVDRRLESFDLITTSLPQFVPWLRGAGIDAELLRIGFDHRVLDTVQQGGSRHGVVFIGSLLRPRWEAGIERIAWAAERVQVDLYGYGAETWPEASIVRQRYRGEAWGIDMYRLLARCAIALNRHGDVAGDYANNMRLYEATGMGALLITEHKRNLGELFEVGDEVIGYRSSDGLVDAIRYYVEHENERSRIALAGQRRTLSDHTYAKRMVELSSILSDRLG